MSSGSSVSSMPSDSLVPETKVLAIASHVVYGHVGNTMATFVMQALGCEVSALNTVHYSNHVGYRQVKGTRATAQEILDIYEGLNQSRLTDFDVLLSGYAPGAEAVHAVGSIAKDLKSKRGDSFFWIMDPVMGDNGRLYVNEDVVPAYKSLLPCADLILPNQFEAEVLSSISITSLSTLKTAITALHKTYHIPHILVTSVGFSSSRPQVAQLRNLDRDTNKHAIDDGQSREQIKAEMKGMIDKMRKYKEEDPSRFSEVLEAFKKVQPPQTSDPTTTSSPSTLSMIGSTATSAFAPRFFCITVPAIDAFFSGTGDMFAALTVARFREAASQAGLLGTKSWISPDTVKPTELPLARAADKVCASMQTVLERTRDEMERELAAAVKKEEGEGDEGDEKEKEKESHLKKTKAAEVRVVRNIELLRAPNVVYEVYEL